MKNRGSLIIELLLFIVVVGLFLCIIGGSISCQEKLNSAAKSKISKITLDIEFLQDGTNSINLKCLSNVVFSSKALTDNVLLTITIKTNYYYLFSNTNSSSWGLVSNLKIKELETVIKLKEERWHELYDGLPEKYVGDGSILSSNQLDKLQILWQTRDSDKLNIDKDKKQLEKLKNENTKN